MEDESVPGEASWDRCHFERLAGEGRGCPPFLGAGGAMWAMLAALAMVTADIGSDWSSAMARGDDRVCFSRVGTGSLAAVGQAPTVVAEEAEVCVDRLVDGTSRLAGHFCGGRFCAWASEQTFGDPTKSPIPTRAERRPDGRLISQRLMPISLLRDVPYGSTCWFYALVRKDGTGTPQACGATRSKDVHEELSARKFLTEHVKAAVCSDTETKAKRRLGDAKADGDYVISIILVDTCWAYFVGREFGGLGLIELNQRGVQREHALVVVPDPGDRQTLETILPSSVTPGSAKEAAIKMVQREWGLHRLSGLRPLVDVGGTHSLVETKSKGVQASVASSSQAVQASATSTEQAAELPRGFEPDWDLHITQTRTMIALVLQLLVIDLPMVLDKDLKRIVSGWEIPDA